MSLQFLQFHDNGGFLYSNNSSVLVAITIHSVSFQAHSVFTAATPKQVISGAPLMEVKSDGYEDLGERALPSALVVVTS